MTRTIDLNADLGEGCAFDADLMTVITSCNIACGGHAGDEASMTTAVQLAKAHQVSAGAHPSFPDRENFGRTAMSLRGDLLRAALSEQVEQLQQIANRADCVLAHLKPHGALYNMAARELELADDIVAVLRAIIPTARLVGPPNSALQRAAAANGVPFVSEGFADRAYQADGQLRSRSETGAVIHEPGAQTEQAIEMATAQRVTTFCGTVIPLSVNTICVHGDTPAAYAAAQSIKAALTETGLKLCAPT